MKTDTHGKWSVSLDDWTWFRKCTSNIAKVKNVFTGMNLK